ncbi:1330_t:CDS:2, partial [Entrophospora sp. SA101]
EQPEHGVYTVFVSLGNTKIELLHPYGDKSPIQNFLEKNKNVVYQKGEDFRTMISNLDDDDLYSAEVDQTVNGSFVYGATPIETTTKNTFETTSASIEKMAKVEAEVEAEEDISLNFEGEDKDTFVLISGLWGFDTIEINLPGGKNYTIADYWSDVKEIVEDPIIVKPSPLGSVHDRAVEIFYQLKGGQV